MTQNIVEMNNMDVVPTETPETIVEKIEPITPVEAPKEEPVRTEETPVKAGEAQPEPEVPVAATKPELTKEETREVKEEIIQKAEEKKEEIIEEVKGQPDHVEKIIDALLEDNMDQEFKTKEAEKRADYFEEQYNKIRKDFNNLKYDDSKIAVSEDDRPLLKLMYEYRSDKDNKELEYRLVARLFEAASDITGEDYGKKVKEFYSGSAARVKELAKPSGGFSSFSVPAPLPKVSGILRTGGKRL